jgi:hypothetical protein
MGATTNATELQDFAIVIGITYPNNSLKGLRGTLNDAAAFTRWLKSKNGGNVPKENIRVVRSPELFQRSQDTAKPVKEQIDDALEELGVSRSKKPAGRRLYFYFAGHGFGLNADEVCMLMAHATPGKLNLNIGLHEYRTFFQEQGYFQEVVFVLDCCRDQVPPRKGIAAQPPPWTLEPDSPPPIVNDLVVLAASNGMKAHETTHPRTRKPRGLFTLALLDVLSGNLDVDHGNLRDTLDARMHALVGANGGTIASQHPTVESRLNGHGGLVLRSASAVSVRIIAPAGATGDLVVYEGMTRERFRRAATEVTRRKPPWLVELSPANLYGVQLEESASASSLFAVINWARLEATKKDGRYVFVFPDAKP